MYLRKLLFSVSSLIFGAWFCKTCELYRHFAALSLRPGFAPGILLIRLPVVFFTGFSHSQISNFYHVIFLVRLQCNFVLEWSSIYHFILFLCKTLKELWLMCKRIVILLVLNALKSFSDPMKLLKSIFVSSTDLKLQIEK